MSLSTWNLVEIFTQASIPSPVDSLAKLKMLAQMGVVHSAAREGAFLALHKAGILDVMLQELNKLEMNASTMTPETIQTVLPWFEHIFGGLNTDLSVDAITIPAFPKIHEVLLNSNSTSAHLLGAVRVGGQIDLKPQSESESVLAERAIKMNPANKHKKVETQRQKEKRLKAEALAKQSSGKSSAGNSQVGGGEYEYKGLSVPFATSLEDKLTTIRSACKLCGIDFEKNCEIKEHEPTHTVEALLNALKISDDTSSPPALKNMFLKAKKPSRSADIKEGDTKLWLITTMHDTKISLKELSKAFGYKDAMRMGKEELLKEHLQLEKGSVTPLGVINDEKKMIQIIFDQRILEETNGVWVHPLTCDASVKMSPNDLCKFIGKSGRSIHWFDFGANKRV